MSVGKNNNYSFNNGSRTFRFIEAVEEIPSLEDFVYSLNIPFEGEFKGEEYVIALENSNDFSEAYNIVSTNKDLNIKNDSIANDSEARFLFYSDNYDISLLADFDDDIYRVVVSRN